MCSNYRDCSMNMVAGPHELCFSRLLFGGRRANMFTKLRRRISAVSCWTVTLTWVCCADALGQSLYNQAQVFFPILGGTGETFDIRQSYLVAFERNEDRIRVAAAAGSNFLNVTTYLDAELTQISRGEFEHANLLTAHSRFTRQISLDPNGLPPQVLIDLEATAYTSTRSRANDARVSTTVSIRVSNGPDGFLYSSPVVGEAGIFHSGDLLNTSSPISVQLNIDQTLWVDESILPPSYSIDTQERALAFIDTLRFRDPANPSTEIPFVSLPELPNAPAPSSSFESAERDILNVAAEAAIFTNDVPVERVSTFMGQARSNNLKCLKDRLIEYRTQTYEQERAGTITTELANRYFERIRKLRGRVDELLAPRPLGPPGSLVQALTEATLAIFGGDPFYGRFTPEQPLTLPFPPQASFRLTQGEGNAGVTIVRPGLWGGGTQDVTVLDSRVTVAQENGVFRLTDFETRLSPFLVNGVSSGENRGFVPPGGQVWSSVDLAAGEFVAYAEGVIVNDMHPANRPIFVFQDIEGFVNFSRGGEVTTATGTAQSMTAITTCGARTSAAPRREQVRVPLPECPALKSALSRNQARLCSFSSARPYSGRGVRHRLSANSMCFPSDIALKSRDARCVFLPFDAKHRSD